MPARRSVLRVALVTALVLLAALVANVLSDGASWSAADFLLAAVLLIGAGLLLELAAAHPRSVALRIAGVVLGAAAIAAGEADDAPGLVLFGLVVIAIVAAVTVGAARRGRSARA